MTTNKPDLSTLQGRFKALGNGHTLITPRDETISIKRGVLTKAVKVLGVVVDHMLVSLDLLKEEGDWQYYTEPKTPTTMEDILKADKVRAKCEHPDMEPSSCIYEKGDDGWTMTEIVRLDTYLNNPFFRDTLGVTVEIVEGE